MLNIHWITEKAREFQKNIYFCFTDYAKAFDCVDHNKLWKILKETRGSDHLTCLLRNWYASQKAIMRTLHRMTCPKLGKEYDKAAYCHPVCLPYIQSTSCKIQGWMDHKLESRLQGEIPISQICRWYHYNSRKWRGTKEPLEEGEKAGLKLNIKKTNTMASGPITSWQIEGVKVEIVTDFIFLVSKVIWMVTIAIKLKDACSLEGKLWQP